jgi:hypothetical protein
MNTQINLLIAAGDTKLDIVDAAKLIGMSEGSIKFLKIFWETAFNKKQFYIDEHFVIDYLRYGGESSKVTDKMTHFYNHVVKKLKKDIDYRVLDHKQFAEEGFVHVPYTKPDGKKARVRSDRSYYVVTGEAVKKIGQMIKTPMGDKIREYFIEIETFSQIMFAYILRLESILTKRQFDQMVEEKKQYAAELAARDEQLAQNTLKINELNNRKTCNDDLFHELIAERQRKYKLDTILIITSREYERRGIYHVARTCDMSRRMREFNTGNVDDDRLFVKHRFETYDSANLIKAIHAQLAGVKFSNTPGFYRAELASLVSMIEGMVILDTNNIEIVNDMLEDYIRPIDEQKYQWYVPPTLQNDDTEYVPLRIPSKTPVRMIMNVPEPMPEPVLAPTPMPDDTKIDTLNIVAPAVTAVAERKAEIKLPNDAITTILVDALNEYISIENPGYVLQEDGMKIDVHIMWNDVKPIIKQKSRLGYKFRVNPYKDAMKAIIKIFTNISVRWCK